jgi:hypothetical protein
VKNHKLGRNISLVGGSLTLLFALMPWNNKDSIGQILFGIQSIIFFITAFMQQKKVNPKM